ncbi:MAG: M48 family metallopeptidase [Saprospiraceae bacterium]|nr:M48 family metallopeptidase [Saprospiraceae bacterium]
MLRKIIIAGLAVLIVACTTVPITGRRQLSLVSASQMMALASEQYQTTLRQSNLSDDRTQIRRLDRVGDRIIQSVEQYLTDIGQSQLTEGYNWEVNLIEDDEVINAWAMPGGKIAFYTGIMKLFETDDEVAVVMAHEIAHAIAGHGGERMSQMLVAQLGGVALDVALTDKPEETRTLAQVAYGLGSQIGILLPFSRTHETEADELGVYFMTMAGYDPQASVNFWEKMAAMGGGAPPEFLSTHPSSQTRINDLNRLIPVAREKFGD